MPTASDFIEVFGYQNRDTESFYPAASNGNMATPLGGMAVFDFFTKLKYNL